MAAQRLARQALRLLQALVPSADTGTFILGYHLVGAGTDLVVDLPTATFRRHLSLLRALAPVVRLRDVLRPGALATRPAHRAFVLTFDDAFENFYSVVWPILREANVPATLFVPVGFIDGDSPTPLRGAERLLPASWDQLRDMVASGLIDIGSHSCSHCDLRYVDAAGLDRELAQSRTRLERELGVTVSAFAYPGALWSRTTTAAVARVYECAVVAGGRPVPDRGGDPHTLPRLPIRRDNCDALMHAVQSRVWLEEWAASRMRLLR